MSFYPARAKRPAAEGATFVAISQPRRWRAALSVTENKYANGKLYHVIAPCQLIWSASNAEKEGLISPMSGNVRRALQAFLLVFISSILAFLSVQIFTWKSSTGALKMFFFPLSFFSSHFNGVRLLSKPQRGRSVLWWNVDWLESEKAWCQSLCGSTCKTNKARGSSLASVLLRQQEYCMITLKQRCQTQSDLGPKLRTDS